ncbi:MAG: ligase-associated DNA damage response endonuclease PdeM [Paracoccaceae bacterium]
MDMYPFQFHGHDLQALASGGLYWGTQRLLVVSDLHLGKSERIARRGGSLLPPFEVLETLSRLTDLVDALDPLEVICLGDSFDDLAAVEALEEPDFAEIKRLAAGRIWTWIEGNHDAGPLSVPGSHLAERRLQNLTFRHIAQPGAVAEVSGHYHPKQRVAVGRARPCFLLDGNRIILPAFGTYTGGLQACDKVFDPLFATDARAVLTGARAIVYPRQLPSKARNPA